MKKITFLKRVAALAGIIAFVIAFILVGAMDAKVEAGEALHSMAWYSVRLVIIMILLGVCLLGIRLTEWAQNLSFSRLEELKRVYGKNDVITKMYRRALRFFKD